MALQLRKLAALPEDRNLASSAHVAQLTILSNSISRGSGTSVPVSTCTYMHLSTCTHTLLHIVSNFFLIFKKKHAYKLSHPRPQTHSLTVMRATTLLLQCVGGRRGGSDKAEEDVEMEGTIAAVAVGSDSSWY